jgi:hypothetical protein
MKKCKDYKGILAKYCVPARGQGMGDALEGTGAVPGRGGGGECRSKMNTGRIKDNQQIPKDFIFSRFNL